MEEILFTKMHGAGNDYIYIDCRGGVPSEPERLAIEMSDRHFGVGSDGLILIMTSEVADFKMRMFNADGSEGRMCGNASRCIAKYVHDYGLTDKLTVTLETLSGIKVLEMHPDADGRVERVTVDMGEPEIGVTEIEVATQAGVMKVTPVSMGNPHGVVFIETSPKDFDVHGIGRELELHPMWPDRANIEFARVVSRGEIEMRVWERGSGETLACGTGACATATAAIRLGLTERKVRLRLVGGDLDIRWDEKSGHIFMTGPAVTVMEGRYFRKKYKPE